jgi:hypothetical protein
VGGNARQLNAKVEELGLEQALQHGSQRIKISSFFWTGEAPFSLLERPPIRDWEVFASDQ